MWQAQHLVALWTLDAAALDAGRRGSGRWTLRRCTQDTVAPDAGRRGAGRWTQQFWTLDGGRRGSGRWTPRLGTQGLPRTCEAAWSPERCVLFGGIH